MTLQNQIETLKAEVGKPRSTRGRGVRAAAIRFEEKFRGAPFNSEQFKEWVASEPSLSKFSNGSTIRERLQAAGYRDDMPQSFEIVRIAKSVWQLNPVEDLILSERVPKYIVQSFKNAERKMQKALQACDLDDQNHFKQFAIVGIYRAFKRCKDMALVGVSGMQDYVLQLNDSDYLALGPGHKDED